MILSILARFILGLLFVFSGIAKTFAFRQFNRSVSEYRLLPAAVVTPFAAIVVASEIAVGTLMLMGHLLTLAAFGAVSLLLIFIFAIAFAAFRGNTAQDCGCGVLGGKVGLHLLLRNVGLACLAPLAVPEFAAHLSGSLRGVALLLSIGAVITATVYGGTRSPSAAVADKSTV